MITKRKWILPWMALFCFLLMSLHANAYNKLSIPDVFVTQGGSIDVPVNLENDDQVVALQFTLTVPNGITIDVNSSQLTNRAPDHSIHIVKKHENDYLCLVFSNNNTAFTGNNGAVINLAVSLPNQVSDGDTFPLVLKDAVASDAAMNNVLTESSAGSIIVGSNITESPTISYSLNDDAAIVTAEGKGEVKLYRDGALVDNPCIVPRLSVDQECTFTATAQEDGKEISVPAELILLIPPIELKDLTGEIVLSAPDENGVVTITYIGVEDVTITVFINGELIEGDVQLQEGDNEIYVTVEAAGYNPIKRTYMITWTPPAPHETAYYLVGDAPFGAGWSPSEGVIMTQNADGTYSHSGTISGSIWFVLADNLATPGDWTTFNNSYRIGPTGGDETVTAGVWTQTQRAYGASGAYKFTGSGSVYTITFNPDMMRFKIDGDVVPPPVDTYTVAGTPTAVFGTEWDPTNTDNDMIRQGDGTYKLVKTNCALTQGSLLELKVVANHDWGECWPDNNFVVYVEESGLYSITFTFNPTTHQIDCELNKQGTIPDEDLPNLHIMSLNCSDPVAGRQMTVQWKVRNDGAAETGNTQWKDYIWLVPSISEGSSMFGSKLLKTVDNLSALAPGESYTNTVNVQLEERVYGNYDLLVTSDMYGVSNIDFSQTGGAPPIPYEPETSDYGFLMGYADPSFDLLMEAGEGDGYSDNFFYKRINIVVPPLPDIQVNNVVAVVDNTSSYGENDGPSPLSNAGLASSTMFYSGKRVKVTATIKNGGGVKIRPTNITNQLYISTSPDLSEGQALLIGSQTIRIELDPGEQTEEVLSGTIPYEWSGETYFVVVADVADAVYESANTGNNMKATPTITVLLTPGADFQPQDLRVPEQVSPAPFDVTYTVKNIGPGVPYVNKWFDKIYISEKSTGIDDTAIKLWSGEQKGRYKSVGNSEYEYEGDSYTKTVTIDGTKIKGFSSNDLYLYVQVDANDDIYEYDGENNNVIMSQKISLVKTDLIVELISISEDTLASDNTVAFSWLVKNNGSVGLTNARIKDRIYAQGGNSSQQIELAIIENTVSIAPGGEKLLHANVNIPTYSSWSGDMNIYVTTNYNKNLTETDFSNNTSASLSRYVKLTFNPSPEDIWATGFNLTGYNLHAPQEATPGQQISVSYTIKNTGEYEIPSNVNQEIYISKDREFSLAASKKCEVNSTLPNLAGLAPRQTVTANLTVSVPDNMQGGDNYLHVVINREKTLQESRRDDNIISAPIYIDGNMPDLAVSDVQVPDVIMTSVPTQVSWTVTNVGEWDATATSCGVYLSRDAYHSYDDVRLVNIPVNSLAKSASIRLNTDITLDDDMVGTYFIIIKADIDRKLKETNLDNNTGTAAFMSQQSPLPDLVISDLVCDDEWPNGGIVTIKATVKNNGDSKTRKDKWADVFYLSEGSMLNPDNAIRIGSKAHVGHLAQGESYEINAELNLPVSISGDYILFAVTDGNQVIIEKNENNNNTSREVYVQSKSDTPADLVVKNVSAPAKNNAGEMVAMSYVIANNGEYPASGVVRDLLYLSKDATWDESDIMVGTAYDELTVNPGEEKTRWVAGRITGVPEGNYHLIVRTNTTRHIAETDYTNNIGIQSNLCSVEFPRLVLGETVTANGFGLYKMPLTSDLEGKTIGIFMTYTDDAFAGLYSSYEQVPNSAAYDYSSHNLEEDHQEILISDVQEGTYYVMAQGTPTTPTSSGGDSPAIYISPGGFNPFVVIAGLDFIPMGPQGTAMTITAREVPFGATTLSVTEGGVDGWISTNVRGALFDSIMDFRLEKGLIMLPAESITFHDQTSSHATFNLHDMKIGSYDFISELPTGARASLPDGFRIVPANSVNLGVRLDTHTTTRVDGYAPVSVSYVNSGNNDIVIRELLLTIDGGYLGQTIEEVKNNPQEVLHIHPNVDLDNRGFFVIPPGREQTFNYYFRQNASTATLNLYIVK